MLCETMEQRNVLSIYYPELYLNHEDQELLSDYLLFYYFHKLEQRPQFEYKAEQSKPNSFQAVLVTHFKTHRNSNNEYHNSIQR